MTEYIVDFGDTSSAFVGLAMAEARSHGAELREPFVRCRDCGYSTDDGYGCMFFSHQELAGDYRWKLLPAEVEPNGFCAWACRKEVGE